MCKTTFVDLWKHTCPDIKIVLRREDCCGQCELMRDAIMKAKSEAEKRDALDKFKATWRKLSQVMTIMTNA